MVQLPGMENEHANKFVAQKRYWSLAGQPLPGYTHQFFTLRNGLKLHYVVKPGPRAAATTNVAVFIHGK
jgi:hypothetical protein